MEPFRNFLAFSCQPNSSIRYDEARPDNGGVESNVALQFFTNSARCVFCALHRTNQLWNEYSDRELNLRFLSVLSILLVASM